MARLCDTMLLDVTSTIAVDTDYVEWNENIEESKFLDKE